MANSAKIPFRVSAVVFLLFALGHTFGFLNFRPPSEAGRAVLAQMMSVSFDFGSKPATWWGLYKGFGLSVSASMIFSAFLAWRLSLPTSDPGLARTVAWLLFLPQVAGIVICLLYFGPVQAVFSAAAAGCLAWGALSVGKGR